MIWVPFIAVFGATLQALLTILVNTNDVGQIPFISTAVSASQALWSGLQYIFPFSVLWACIAVDLAFEVPYFAYKGIRWAYRKIPGVT